MGEFVSNATRLGDETVTSGLSREKYLLATNKSPLIPPYPTPVRPIASYEIEEIMPAMQSGIAELKNAILTGEYTALVGDDTSGRIPTLILRGVISHVNTALGRPSLPAIFVKGRYEELSSLDEQRLSQKMRALSKRSDNPRALIVTEYMSGGSHVAGIGKVIHSAGVAYDIFATGRPSDINSYRNRGVLRNDENVFPASVGLGSFPSLHRNRKLSGYRERFNGFNEAIEFIPAYRLTFNEARKDVKVAIGRLVNDNFV
jgi:hypothetical protein